MEYPFYSVTIPVDVTNVKAVSSRAGVSFYHLMIWVCTKAVNAVPAFRLRVRDGQVVRLAHTEPSFTSLRGGSEQFQIITIPWEEDWVAFCGRAAEVSGAQTAFITPAGADDGLIYFPACRGLILPRSPTSTASTGTTPCRGWRGANISRKTDG